MTVVFDAEPLLAFAFDEPGAEAVEDWLDRVYDGEVDGCVTTVNLAEFRYIAVRETSAKRADGHLGTLRQMGVTEYGVDGLWRDASALKGSHSLSLGDAYAVAAASEIHSDEQETVLLVGADDDYDVFEQRDGEYRIERFRDTPA